MSVAPDSGRTARLLELAALVLILLFATHLRVQAVFGTAVIEPVRADAVDYLSYAINLRQHGVYSREPTWVAPGATPVADAYRPPGYALFLLPWVEAVPTEPVLHRIRLVQVVLGVAGVLLAWLLARRLLPRPAALLVAALCAISPHLVNGPLWILSEVLFTLLLLGALYAALDRDGRVRRGWSLLPAVVLLGLAMLTRPTLQYLPVLLLVVAWRAWGVRELRATLLVTLVGLAATLGPWYARNLHTLGAVGDDRLAFYTLLHGIYPDFMLDGRAETLGFPYRFDRAAPAPERGAGGVVRELARRATADPWTYLRWYAIGKPISFVAWNEVRIGDAFILQVADTPYFHRREFLATHLAARVLHWPLMLAAALGMLLAWRAAPTPDAAPRREGVRLLALLLLYMVAVHVVGAPYPRYSVPLRAVLYIVALCALGDLWRMLRPAHQATPLPQ